ncbi:ATP-binding protein [Streptomyces sp. SID8014]|uniref:AAA family ATPase n=1 Tax=Streptomyces sp. SID8014 TaxID=2706097 RepID=UPI0013B88CA6|nr:ATP-binding protein [Streptomyces sp. SID8014]
MTTVPKRKRIGQRRQSAAAPANETSRRRPDLRPQHFLGLKDSTLVATDTLLQIKDTVIDTIESRAMSVIYGDPGLGKSFSTRATIQEMNPDLILPLDFARSRPGPKDLREELFHQMRLNCKMPGTPTAFDKLLRESLPRRPYVIVCDEAQQYRRENFEFLRKLWDNCDPQPAIVFVGGREAYETLQSDPALASRIYIRLEILAMTEDEILKTVPDSHPVWRGVDEALLKRIDTQYALGSFREWVKVTKHVLKGMEHLGAGTVDETVVEWALGRC